MDVLICKKTSSCYFFNLSYTKGQFQRLIGKPLFPTLVKPLGVDSLWFEEIPQENPFTFPYFLTIRNLKPHKNIVPLCQAFAAIASQCPHHLVLAGKKKASFRD